MYKFLLYLRTTLFNIGYYGSGIVVGGLSPLIWLLLPFRARYWLLNRWNVFVMAWLRLCCGVRIRVIGERHRDLEPCVVMAKHQSTWETLYLQYYFAPISPILKKELLSIPFFGWGLASLRPIAIDRSNPIQALKDVKAKSLLRLKQGCNVLIFPEGTRTAPGSVGTYARSGADIACKANTAIIPVAHNGAECWPHKHYLKYPGTITLVIGEPISTEGRNRKDLTIEVQEWIETTLKTLPPGRADGIRLWQTQP
ncbi:1-acyl-sn-glycerol-3-phosphate acyltransferase [Marinimicrobium sp. ABcell2]|uniref:lysophospholipid acyltransferase family protein n=1 Tax=Marinimicrobium sp. ABcell2 TaxID=3069751 RepID=UPI0027B535C3|nr:lysophospholipid acyltransferase family protein [Marinimicrobium sp. ABcell2]MDQ2076814.1 lysophospholipid acyltransferase family protein [Marinimicrobium sp. ABcell2]